MTRSEQPLADLEPQEAALTLVSSGGRVPAHPVTRTCRAVQESQELFWIATSVLDAARGNAPARLPEWDAARLRIRAGHPSPVSGLQAPPTRLTVIRGGAS